jgi:hypothetical protein
MRHQLKIIMSGEFNSMVKVYIDDKQVGLIQDIKFHASANEHAPHVEIVFPNLFALDKSQFGNDDLLQSLQSTLDLLKEMPNVKVTLLDLEFPQE